MKDYKKILEGVMNIINTTEKSDIGFVNICTYISENCPELKESEDERIRKRIYDYINVTLDDNESEEKEKWLAFLSKQGGEQILANSAKTCKDEQKPANKVEPKFKVGYWVVCEVTGLVDQIKNCIENLSNHKYGYELTNGGYIGSDEVNNYHLWNIGYARHGNVLTLSYASKNYILIYKRLYEKGINIIMSVCCFYCVEENEYYDETDNFHVMNSGEIITPATNEQCALLFQKMKEAGYEWDSEKKQPRKIEQKPEMIQWTGNNLREVADFTGVHPMFSVWFKTWEDYETYVHNHDDIYKLFDGDGNHMEVPVGAWIMKAPDGYCVASKYRFVQKRVSDWSSKDQAHLESIDESLFMFESGRHENVVAGIEDDRNWLNSLKERVLPQQKPEWSEEDERNMNWVINVWNRLRRGGDAQTTPNQMEFLENWLKSLRTRKQWKPSEEQLKSLQEVIDTGHFTSYPNALETLYEQLKKLRDE